MPGALGRKPPPDWEHVEKYPLTASEAPAAPVPMAIGVTWYTEFDNPQQDSAGNWWVARDGRLTTARGGHCVVLKSRPQQRPIPWWEWWDQVSEGICVSEGITQMMALLNRHRYQPRPLYDWCKAHDGIPNEEGTFVRTGLEGIRDVGLVRAEGKEKHWIATSDIDQSRQPTTEDGISAFRWATSIDDVLQTVGYADKGYVVMLNSWGKGYPRHVRIPAEVLEQLRREDGEFGVITDR